ncbi:MAG: hypothetical protein AVDCRST_MAG93-9224 [uncultured Chloroflexia bacterium]|uniref:Uncharacterized protein n=1 Tax=uncultured Chloroflexia bacterium TaxID=1672391 RepID=A0A6J4NDF1_9CHLR|nr:MAG: hypothetical protein AVDCRST_MAG93-9224 [uncultured Chloroflexia bacterium]
MKVIVTVDGGVAEVAYAPLGVSVEIIDFDDMKESYPPEELARLQATLPNYVAMTEAMAHRLSYQRLRATLAAQQKEAKG